MKESLLKAMADDLWSDLQRPLVIWQIAVIFFCLMVSWGIARYFLKRLTSKQAAVLTENALAQPANFSLFLRFDQTRIWTIFFPLLAALLIFTAHPFLGSWARLPLIRMAVVLALSMAVIRFFVYVLRRTSSHPWLAAFERVLVLVVWLVVLLYVTGWYSEVNEFLESVRFSFGRTKVTLWEILNAIFTVLLGLVAALWLATAIESRLMQSDTLDMSLRVVLARLARAMLIVLSILLALSIAGLDLTLLSVFGGALGVGLGLGLQRIASNYVSGFIILLERSLRMGDMITADKYYGSVSQIKTRYTVLKALDGTEAIIPNELLVSTSVQNHSYTDRRVRLACNIQISYQSDLERALKLMVEASQAHSRVLTDPLPTAFLLKFAGDGMELELGFWIRDPEEGTLGVRSDINRAIWRAFCEHGIEVPYAQRDVRILSVPNLTGVPPP